MGDYLGRTVRRGSFGGRAAREPSAARQFPLPLRSERQMLRRGLFLLLPLFLAGCGYNTIQGYDEAAAKAKQDIEVQLQRRADLVPNLVNTVKGFAQQEQDVFVKVTEARAGLTGAIKGGNMGEMANPNQA